MGILHDMLAKIHLASDNALQLADPKAAQTEANHGFLAEVADMVHGLESRIVALETSLFGTKQAETPAEAPAPAAEAPNVAAAVAGESSAVAVSAAEPSSTEPSA